MKHLFTLTLLSVACGVFADTDVVLNGSIPISMERNAEYHLELTPREIEIQVAEPLICHQQFTSTLPMLLRLYDSNNTTVAGFTNGVTGAQIDNINNLFRLTTDASLVCANASGFITSPADQDVIFGSDFSSTGQVDIQAAILPVSLTQVTDDQEVNYQLVFTNVGSAPAKTDIVDFFSRSGGGEPYMFDGSWTCVHSAGNEAVNCGTSGLSGSGIVELTDARIGPGEVLTVNITRSVQASALFLGQEIELMAVAFVDNDANTGFIQDSNPANNVVTRNLIVTDNQQPTISSIAAQVINEDGSTGALAFTVGDAETPAGSLSVSVLSSNTSVVGVSNVFIGGSGANRTVTVTPVANRNTVEAGPVNVTVRVTDGGGGTADSVFSLTVNPINDKPSFTICGNVTHEILAGSQPTCGDNRITFANFVTSVDTGPFESGQTVLDYDIISVVDTNSILDNFGFPDIDIDPANGNLNYGLSGNYGIATIQAVLIDSGGTANGGINASDVVEFTLTVPGPDVRLESTLYLGHDGGFNCDTATDQLQTVSGSNVTYCYRVLNTGSTYLDMTALSDSALGITVGNMTIIGTPGILAPGGEVTYFYQSTVSGDLNTNASVTVNPVDELGNDIVTLSDVIDLDSATLDEIAPSILLEKTVYAGHTTGADCAIAGDSIVVNNGDDVTYCYRFTNTGDTHLDLVSYFDSGPLVFGVNELNLLSGPDLNISLLGPGQIAVYYLESNDTVNGTAAVQMNPVQNTGADIPGMVNVSDSDSTAITVQ